MFWILQTAFVGVILVFIIHWFVKRISHLIDLWRYRFTNEDANQIRLREEENRAKHDVWKQKVQKLYEDKAAIYKETVQIPREKEKRERKEKEFIKYFGTLWCGEGSKLGGAAYVCEDVESEAEIHETDNVKAARRRNIHEPDPPATKPVEQKYKPKRVIKLPDEPSELDTGAISIILRTPISTTVKRRFLHDYKFQSVLDFMTMCGFNESHYQLCSSFPRKVLSDSEVPLSQLGFGKRVTLNIEDKSED